MQNPKKRVLYSSYTAHENTYKGKDGFQPSLTVPDDTMTMREMIMRHTRGLEVNTVERKAIYSDSNGVNPATLDNVDIQARKLKNQDRIDLLEAQRDFEEVQERLDKLEKASHEAVRNAKIDGLIEKNTDLGT